MDCVEHTAENLAMRPGTRITASVIHPTGGGARDPSVLLNELANCLDGRDTALFGQASTFNTYDGQNRSCAPDWYAIEFSAPVRFNSIEMTMGFPYRDGGWWTSLMVETRTAPENTWQPVERLEVLPAYSFIDERGERRPYETFALTFDDRSASAVRLIGQAGGLAEFTSLARIGVYERDLSRWNPITLPDAPTPHIFRLLSSSMISDLSESLAKLTGLVIVVPFMEYYLDDSRYRRFWQRVAPSYHGKPDLWFVLAESLGWDTWRLVDRTATDLFPLGAPVPRVRRFFFDVLATAVAPVIVDNHILCELASQPVILADTFNWNWHRRYAAEYQLPWADYRAAIDRSVHLSMEQLDGASELMGMFANTIANLAHRNQLLERELSDSRTVTQMRKDQRRALVRHAIDFMQRQLEAPITVADVARECALSLSHFSTLFTEHTGRNPSTYLIGLRLERAREYLAHTDMSVLEVCDCLGYDPSYFSRLFKHHTGSTPGQYALRARAK